MVRQLEPKTWIHSFKKVNLHPHHRVSFQDWCERISHFLQGGESFKPEVLTDGYALLPSFWHGMLPEEKKLISSIFTAHANSYSMACVRELHERAHIPMADMHNLRVCLELAAEDPTHLERSMPEASSATPDAVVSGQAAMTGVAQGLVTFQLHPKGPDGKQLYTGMAKFEHLVKMARRSAPREQQLAPSAHLGVEITPDQQKLLDPTAQDYAMHTIMSTTHGEGAKKAMAQRKLDALGNMRGACGFANDPERLKRLENQLKLATSIAEINKITEDEKATKKSTETAGLIAGAPDAIKKLKDKGGDISKLTIKEIEAIAFASFNGQSLKGDKAAHITALTKLAAAHATVLCLPATATATAMQLTAETPAAPTAAVPTPAAPTLAAPTPIA